MNYIIDKDIQFNTQENKLFYRKDHGRYVILNAPAARCLALLLEASPEIVSQDIFITKVWSDNGMLVSANTLYQNISMVRRALREVSNKDITFIKTVTRKGFQFNDQIHIELNDEIFDLSEINNSPSHDYGHVVKKEKTNTLHLFGLSLIGLLLGQIPMFVKDKFDTDKTTFKGYSMVTNYKGCTLFYENHDIDSSGLAQKLTTKIDYFGIDCKENPAIYISTYSAGPEFTALLCKDEIASGKDINCESIHYRKDGGQ